MDTRRKKGKEKKEQGWMPPTKTNRAATLGQIGKREKCGNTTERKVDFPRFETT